MVIQERPLLSVEEYLALPEEKPYIEYVNGRVCPKPMPDWMHAQIVQDVIRALDGYIRDAGGWVGAEGGARFDDPADVRLLLPDVSFYAKGVRYREIPMPPPTLAVEVRSPEQPMRELREKCRYYRAHGVGAAWIIDPERRTAEVHEAGREGVALTDGAALESAVLPGFRLALSALFAVLDEPADG